MQTLALGREACIALDMKPFPDTRVWPTDHNFNFQGLWLPSIPKEVRARVNDLETSKVLKRIKAKQAIKKKGVARTVSKRLSHAARTTSAVRADSVTEVDMEAQEEVDVGAKAGVEQAAWWLPDADDEEMGDSRSESGIEQEALSAPSPTAETVDTHKEREVETRLWS